MSWYNSTNTTILSTHVVEHGRHPNTRMLLLHECENGKREFVIGSYFTQTTEVSSCQEYERTDYSWDWGHYFTKFESAASYWFEEVLNHKKEPADPGSGFICPKCGGVCRTGMTSLDGWDDDLLNGYVFVDITCPSCKAEYTNNYKLESSELTYEEH